jgi:hypothetical protein
MSEAEQFLANPNLPFCGSALISKEIFDQMTRIPLGDYKMPTDTELLHIIQSAGFEDLVLIDVESDAASGFQATAFKDQFGNIGISFRGSDLDLSQGGLMDWLEADFMEYFTNDSLQRHKALDFFEKNKSQDGHTYLYGHSLGGNLSSHIYLEHHREIERVFIVNGYPINPKLLNTSEKIAAFNSKSYVFNSVCGDMVSHFKSCEPYENNVRWVKNNGNIKASIMSAHLTQSASCDANGKFVTISKEEMLESMGKTRRELTTLAQKLREHLNIIEDKVQYSKNKRQEAFAEYKREFDNWIELGWDLKVELLKSAAEAAIQKHKPSIKQKKNNNSIEEVEIESQYDGIDFSGR